MDSLFHSLRLLFLLFHLSLFLFLNLFFSDSVSFSSSGQFPYPLSFPPSPLPTPISSSRAQVTTLSPSATKVFRCICCPEPPNDSQVLQRYYSSSTHPPSGSACFSLTHQTTLHDTVDFHLLTVLLIDAYRGKVNTGIRTYIHHLDRRK